MVLSLLYTQDEFTLLYPASCHISWISCRHIGGIEEYSWLVLAGRCLPVRGRQECGQVVAPSEWLFTCFFISPSPLPLLSPPPLPLIFLPPLPPLYYFLPLIFLPPTKVFLFGQFALPPISRPAHPPSRLCLYFYSIFFYLRYCNPLLPLLLFVMNDRLGGLDNYVQFLPDDSITYCTYK